MECCILLYNNGNFDHFLLNRNDQYPRIFDSHEDAEEYIYCNNLVGSVIINYYIVEPMKSLLSKIGQDAMNRSFYNYSPIKIDIYNTSI